MLGTLQRPKRKYKYHRCQYKRTGGNNMAKTKRRKPRTSRIRRQIFIGTEKKYAINELELLAVVWGLELFRLYIYGTPIELLPVHQALEPLTERNRTNKTYSARLTRWLDRLAHFDMNIKHITRKHLALTDYLNRNPISKPEPIENYDERYVINCIMPLLEFINSYGSVVSQKNRSANGPKQTARTNHQPIIAKQTKQTEAKSHYHIQIQSIQIDSTPFKPFKK